jgi:anti-sigma regulatory factor (Ser/Thr protein kinase)
VALGLPEDTHGTLELLVSELVTNSVRHAGPAARDPATADHPIELRVTHSEGVLHVAVRDGGSGFSRSDVSIEPKQGGLGLMIVNALSKMWGVECARPGCTVWCTIDAQRADAQRAA